VNDDDGRDVPAGLEMQQPGPCGGCRGWKRQLDGLVRLAWEALLASCGCCLTHDIGRACTPSVQQRRLRTRRLAKPTNGVVHLLCLATGKSIRAATPGKPAAVLGQKTQVRLHGRVNCALIQWLTICVSKREEVGFQSKIRVVDPVAVNVH
jgi:hypothetical protein